MKKFTAVVFLVGFAVAVCHAVPYASGTSPTKTEIASKKGFELHAAVLPEAILLPAAPVFVYDTDVRLTTSKKSEVLPKANSPPRDGWQT